MFTAVNIHNNQVVKITWISIDIKGWINTFWSIHNGNFFSKYNAYTAGITEATSVEEAINAYENATRERVELTKLQEEIDKYHEHIGKVNNIDEFFIYIQKQIKKIIKSF